MKRFERLKRSVAHGLRKLAGGRSLPDTGGRRDTAETVATRGEVIRLAWPIAVAMLGDTAMGLVDAKLVAGLGSAAIGGVGVAMTLVFLSYAVTYGFLRGVKVRTAFAVGEGRPDDGVRFAQAGVAVALVVGVLTWALARDVAPFSTPSESIPRRSPTRPRSSQQRRGVLPRRASSRR